MCGRFGDGMSRRNISKMAHLTAQALFDVKGRISLVTGGSSGIGYMIAKTLVQNGAKVYIVALPTDDIDTSVTELNTIGQASAGQAIGFPGDLSTKEGILQIANYLTTHESHLDILISNAGVRRDPPQLCQDLKSASLDELQTSLWSSIHSDWDDTFRVNVTAHYFLSVALMKLLAAAADLDIDEDGNPVTTTTPTPISTNTDEKDKDKDNKSTPTQTPTAPAPATRTRTRTRKGRTLGRGTILCTSSCASMHNSTNIDLTSYAASKAALDHLVRLLATKFAPWYIRVNSINPGFLPSRMNPVDDANNQFATAGLFDRMPAKRIGREEDVAGVVLWLCSEAGAYVDGGNVVVDGGRILMA